MTDNRMHTSDFNMNKISSKQLERHIAASIEIGGNIFVAGRRGTGKTVIAKDQITKSGLVEVYLNMSVLERTDMGGYPDVLSTQRKDEFVNFILPRFYEPLTRKNGPKVVALLDEVDKADPSLWAPLLEFTQFHSINGNKLENLQAVIMTGNLLSEGGNRPSLPLLDRAEKYIVEADQQSWLEWAGKSGRIHPSITAYISDHPVDLFGAADPQDRYADPSPRGWHRASEIIKAGEAKGWGYEILNEKVAGCVGKDAGIKYSNYYEHYQQLLPMIEEMFKGKNITKEYKKLEPGKKLVACMISCARLATQLDNSDPSKPPKSIEHVGNFLSDVEYENVLVAVRSQVQVERLIKYGMDEHPAWQKMLETINQQADSK